MPREQDEIEDLNPESSAGNPDVVTEADKTATAAPAESSAATDDEGNEILNVVRDVVDERVKAPEAASSAEGEEAGEKTGDQPTTEQDNEDYSDVPFNKHPRFRQLLNERNTFKTDAVRYRNVETFLDNHGLGAEEAADFLMVAALAKTNPAKAWEMAKPWVQGLLVATGDVLPDDLQQRVQAGELTVDAAKEISRSRATVKAVETRQTFEQKQQERRQQADLETSIADAANEWEADRFKKDPNFGAKHAQLQKEVAFLIAREGKPKTPDGVKDVLQRAYKATNDTFQPPAPTPTPPPRAAQRPPLRPVNGGQVAGNARPKAESTFDIIDQVVSRRSA